jgi:hypothetical protein
MKTVFFTVLIAAQMSFASVNTKQDKTWTFSYQVSNSQSLKIQKAALTFEAAFKLAAKDCYQQMTHGKYPGEDKGLEIIDICANPKS